MARRRRHSRPLLLALLIGWGCGGTPQYDPFLVPPETLLTRVETIALTPLQPPPDLDLPEPILASFDSLIASRLRGAGFATVDPEAYAEIWDRIQLELGGLFDPLTGEVDELKQEEARDLLVWELHDQFGAEALLFADLVIVDAPFAAGVAQWDETSQTITGFGWRLLDALGFALSESGGSLPEGTVPALSLSLALEDLSGGQLYASTGGIEVLQKVGPDDSDRTPVPPERLCRSRRRRAQAVEIALRPLLERARQQHLARQ